MPDPQRILVVKLSALGDLFHAMPVVHRLSEHYGIKVDWVTQPEYAELVSCHQDVDRVIAFPRRGAVRAFPVFVRQLRARNYDLALDLQGLTKSGLVLGLCRARRKIGSSRPREMAGLFAGETPKPTASTLHAMDRLFDSLRHLGIDPDPVHYPLRFPEQSGFPADSSPVVALAPRSRWPAKDWPLEKYRELGERLIRDFGARVWVIGGKEDREAGEILCRAFGNAGRNLCGRFSLLALGALLDRVDCLVCNDSGPMHFAAAVGTPLVALFGPTDPERTGPRSPAARVLRPPPGEAGYPDPRSYKQGSTEWISRIPVSEVLEAVRSQLQRVPEG
ncbi:MAG: glycosyltransferase family 9 protein [Kiritimatiellia bacterium]